LGDDVLELLAELNKKTFLWVELGLQTVNDDVAKYFNRAYETQIYKEASEKLNKLNIKFVTHIIIGLPKEEEDDYLKTAIFAQNCGTWGIKIHLMYVVKNTPLEKLYLNGGLKVNTKEEYVEKVINILENISPEVPVYGTCLDGENIYNQKLSSKGIIVMGNEGKGVSTAIKQLFTHKLLIPNYHPQSAIDSLNVAIATAITCAEFKRQDLV